MLIMIASVFVPYYIGRWLLPDLQNITISGPGVWGSVWTAHTFIPSSMMPVHLQAVFLSNSFTHLPALLPVQYTSEALCTGCPQQGVGSAARRNQTAPGQFRLVLQQASPQPQLGPAVALVTPPGKHNLERAKHTLTDTPVRYLCTSTTWCTTLLLTVLVPWGGGTWKSFILMMYFHMHPFSFLSLFRFLC